MELTYSPEKKQFLTEVSPESLRDWVLEIPLAKLNSIAKDLPLLKGGFRPGKDVPIRLLTFFGKMSRWSEDDWALLGRIWVLWTQDHPTLEQGLGVSTLDGLLELTRQMVEKPEVRRNAVMELVAASRGTALHQDLIRAWYDKGPMPPDNDVNSIINMAHTASEAALPVRVATIEQRVTLFEEGLKELLTEFRTYSATTHPLQKLVSVVAGLESGARVIDDRVQGISKRLSLMDETATRITRIVETHDQALRKTRDHVFGLQAQLDTFSVELSNLKDSVGTLPDLPAAELRTAESIGALNIQVEDVQRDLVTLREELAQLTARTERPISVPSGRNLEAPPRPTVKDLSRVDVVRLSTLKEATDLLTRNLNGLGIKLPQAQSLSVDVLSALSTGQLVTFAGSMAGWVAERCALSLAGDHLNVVKIPVGLLDGRCLDPYVKSWRATAKSGNSAVGIIIDGVTCSALELFGSNLRSLVIDRLTGLGDDFQLLLFATVADGPSTIPYGRDLLELGPLFDTDALGWLDSSSRTVVPGSMCLDDWSNPVSDVKLDWEESWIPQRFLSRAGVLWRKALGKAALFRHHVNTTGEGEIPTELAFGWVLPMALLIAPQEVGAITQNISLDIRGENLLVVRGVEVDSE